MTRYFLEVAYKGTRYSGFQVQENAITIQSEVEAAFQTLHRCKATFTGSSRTDAGVHALQNFFHFDFGEPVHPQAAYKLNAMLPADIVVRRILPMPAEAHSRFDAVSREYSYHIHRFKNPFLHGASLYYPYKLDLGRMNEAASLVKSQTNFTAFSKTNTQVKNFNCAIIKSEWMQENEGLIYTIEANRFLRGMVRLLTATLLQVGRGRMEITQFETLFLSGEKCGLSVSALGLYLNRVRFADGYLPL